MKIAFIITVPIVFPGHGVVSQAMTWKKGLESLGHEVVLADMWKPCDWKSFDIVQIFMHSEYCADYIEAITSVNKNIVFAPVLDPDFSINAMKCIAHWGFPKLKLSNRYYRIRKAQSLVKKFLVRSDFEAEYVQKGWCVDKKRIFKIPLSFNYTTNYSAERDSFCFHASYLADDRKNVKRLIEAAKKYNFPLKLAGKLRSQDELDKVMGWIGNSSNIEYMGFLTQEKLLEMYKKARAFALPSVNEGVGIVALDAAAMGCDIVLTNYGGPKEYYDDLAFLVNPKNVDEIGSAVMEVLNGKSNQPRLQQHIVENYSLKAVSERLVQVYEASC